MKKNDIKIPKNTLEAIIENYTRESGVRELEKKSERYSVNLHANMLRTVILRRPK